MTLRALRLSKALLISIILSLSILAANDPLQPRGGHEIISTDVTGDFFHENLGQIEESSILFYTTLRDGFVELANGSVSLHLRTDDSLAIGHTIGMTFPGGKSAVPVGLDGHQHRTHFLHGEDPTSWVSNVRSFQRVIYPAVYEGIDLMFSLDPKGLKYDVLLDPGAELSEFTARYHGVRRIEIEFGTLLIHTESGTLRDSPPMSYQDGRKIECRYVLKDAISHGFACDDYDPSLPLVIDPLLYSTYLGHSERDYGYDVAVDAFGDVYVTGTTDSPGFPTTAGAFNRTHMGSRDVFVAKFDSSGTPIYITFLGGDRRDEGLAITADASGSAYVTGRTDSINFPVTPGAYNTTFQNQGYDTFIVKLTPSGDGLVFSTFLGHWGIEHGNDIVVDLNGDVYVTGLTDSASFPTTSGAHDRVSNASDAFVTKLAANGTALVYSTFLGGDGPEEGFSLAVDRAVMTVPSRPWGLVQWDDSVPHPPSSLIKPQH